MAVKDSADAIAGKELTTGRPIYDRVWRALSAAHEACFKHPNRDVLGMSNGPFSGVNETLGIVADMESKIDALQARVKELEDHNRRLGQGGAERYWENRYRDESALATRLQQERDDAYERLKPFADAADKLDDVADALRCNDEEPIGDVMWPDDQPTAGNIRAARDLVRSLSAGPEKEK